ncbi:MAG: glycosyltransferase [bacterium]
MRILWLIPQIPWPADTGGKQDTYFMIREFSRLGHEIKIGSIYFTESPPDRNEIPVEFADLVREIIFLPGNTGKLHSRLISSLADTVPFKFRKYYSPDAVRMTTDLISGEKFDAIITDHAHLAPLTLDAKKAVESKGGKFPAIALRAHNVESIIVKKYSERVGNPLVGVFAERESKKMEEYEGKILGEYNLVASISPADKATFERISSNYANIIVITAGIDTEALTVRIEPPKAGEIVYVGSFDWQPNVDGALWFIEKVWPDIVNKLPDVHFSLVGRNPPPYLEKFASDKIKITGKVDSVTEYVKSASCSIVPLWIGSGMRYKILEAFALGCPVVSTLLGAEGIEAVDGEHILIRDNPADFAEAVIKILSDRELGEKLASNSRLLVENKYSWPIVAREFSDRLEELVRTVE